MEIVSEAIELVETDVPEPEPPTPEPKRRVRAESKAKPRVRKPVAEVVEVAAPVEVAPVEPTMPEPRAVKPRARKPPATATAAPAPAPGISDVLGMLATALLDQRQARSSQRQAMYSRFLD